MADTQVQFLPLELWRASALAQETKTIIAAYERCLATGDTSGVSTLRRAISRRIDDLQSFYLANVEDERSVLFEKQRLRLRKLLADYDGVSAGDIATMSRIAGPEVVSAAASGARAGPAAAPPPVPSQYQQAQQYYQQQQQQQQFLAPMPTLAVTKEIREDTRLNGQELLAWFTQAGAAEMPEVPAEAIARVFASVTRTNSDGKMSVRDVRQWYITFGKRAAKEGILLGTNNSGAVQAILSGLNPAMSASLGPDGAARVAPGLGQDEIVSVAFVKAVGAAAVTARKEASLHEKRKGVVDFLASGGATGGGAAGALGSSGLLSGSTSSRRPIYAWENSSPTRAAAAEGGAGAAPLTLPNGILEFQVRLTPEEYAHVTLAKRKMEAEQKYAARIRAAKERQDAIKHQGSYQKGGAGGGSGMMMGGGIGGADDMAYQQGSTLREGEYQDPAPKNSYFYRSP